MDVAHSVANGQPLPVLLYGTKTNWKAGVVIVSNNHRHFQEILFGDGSGAVDDKYGLTYHQVQLAEGEVSLGVVGGEFTMCLDGNTTHPFWDCGLMLADALREDMEGQQGYRFAMIRSNWQHLDMTCRWNEFEWN